MTRGFLLNNQTINGKVGIIGDSAGTGKTLSILKYLSEVTTFPKITCELANNSSKYFFSHELYRLSDKSTNLVIVPHSLFNQWQQEISKHTTISYFPVETKRSLKDNVTDTIVNSTFILTTNTCYKYVQEYANKYNIQWNNICIDEASAIYFNSSDPKLKFQFLWFITNNWIPLLFKNPSISKSNLHYLRNRIDVHPELDTWLYDKSFYNGILVSSFLKEYLPFLHEHRGLMVLRNSSKLINVINLPVISTEIIYSKQNITLNSLMSYYLSKSIDPTISSNKVIQLFQSLDVEFNELEEYIRIQPVVKHSIIRNKHQDAECAICLEICEHVTIVNCCYNIYCGKCLLTNILMNHKCPTCREVLLIDNICCLKVKEQIPKNKKDACIDILQNNRNGKFIIYSSFNNIFYQLYDDIDKLGLKAERIDNGLMSLLKIIKNFNNGITNILFISNIDIIRGLSLESTSHLIFYHEPPVYELKQILIHSGQRIGRQSPLKIIYLNSEIQS